MKENGKYLILAGTNKAGTTSLFNYLKDHPEICGSYIKQTGFFLDKNYQLAKTNFIHHFDDNPEAYDSFFKETTTNTKYKLEATPDYMYSNTTPDKIKSFFKNKDKDLTLIFILRDPVDRFYSWFKYAKQIGKISPDTCIEDFFNMNNSGTENTSHMCFQALETGKYYQYINHFESILDDKKILVYSYEDLIKQPKEYLQKIARDLDIKPSFYETYKFETFNKSVKIKNATINSYYLFLSNQVRKFLNKSDFFSNILNPLLRLFTTAYKNINTTEVESTNDSISFEKKIRAYYSKAS